MRRIFNVVPSKDNTACILLYGDIGGHERVSASEVVSELMALQAQYRKIDVRINSLGGEVYDGIAIFNAIRNSTADIEIYVDGVAASIASIIALCGKPLHMSRFSRLMLHQVSGGAYGTAKDMRDVADEIEKAQATLAEMIAAKCKMTAEEVTEKFFSGGDHWLTSSQALAMGLADSIYDTEGEQPEPGMPADDIYAFTNKLMKKPLKKSKDMLLDELKKRKAFSSATSEEQALQTITTLENQAAEAASLKAKVKTLEDEKAAALKAAHDTILEQAVADGRIKAEQKDTFRNLLASDETNAKALLNSLPKKSGRIVDIIDKASTANDLAGMTWDQIDRAGRLSELKNNHPELYKRKFDETFKNNK
ncbi:MAG: head maturation protease, ClpP-related [Candidatus Egerieousia sp.]